MDSLLIITVLKELLLKGKAVVVPGLGIFETRYHPAQIRSESGYLLPPSGRMVLSQEKQPDDGFLEQEIIERLGCSPEEAKERLGNFTAMVVGQLSRQEPVYLEGIGTISSDPQGNLSFTPAAGLSFLPDAFGLVPFRVGEAKPVNR